MNNSLYQQGLLLITPYHRSQRGNTLTTQRITKGLKARGIPVDLFSMEQDQCVQRLQDMLSVRSYALIHAFHATHFGRLLAQLPALHRYPLVLTITGTDINVDLKEDYVLFMSTIQSSDALIIFNAAFQSTLTGLLQGANPNLAVIPQGVDLPNSTVLPRKSLGLAEDDVVFLMPTGLRPVKNIEMALDGLEMLAHEDPRVKLLIMGPVIDGTYGGWILERVESLPWGSYLGEIPHEKMAGYLGVGDVVLNCSQSEGQPQAALEAMSLGIPAVLSLVPGNQGIIQEGQEGFYVSRLQDFIQKARALLLDSDLRRRMGQAARNLVKERFNPEAEVEQHIQLYNTILSNTPLF